MLDTFNPFYWLRRAYDWTLTWAQHKYNTTALAVFGFCGAIFFPVPLDMLIITMAAAKPKKALYYAGIAATSSVIGAIVAYFIGSYFWLEVQNFFSSQEFYETFNNARVQFQENTFKAMLISGFTFLPFKLFTISAGVSEAPFLEFLSGCIAGRFLRFFILGIPLYFYGERMTRVIDHHFNRAVIITILALVLIFSWTYI